MLDRADHGDHILVAQCLSLLVNGWVPLFVEDYLRDSAAISNIDKDKIAQVAPAADPAHEYGVFARVGRAQCAAHVSTS